MIKSSKQTPFDWVLRSSQNLFVKKGHHSNTPENLGKLRFLAVSSHFGVVFILFLLFASNLPNRNYVGAVTDVVLLAIIGIMMLLTRKFGLYRLAYNMTVAMLAIALPIGFFAPSADRSLFLLPVVLLYAYFLLGKSGGLRWTIIVYVLNGIAIIIDYLSIAELGISVSYLMSGSVALYFISLLLYTFENNNEINQSLIHQQAGQLKEANQTLQLELNSRVELTQQLQTTLKEFEENNKQLEKSKRALLNVLEDSNELQEQLSQEKADVEKKIEIRTLQLQEEQARLHASIDTLDIGFLMTLKNGKSILHNPALMSICNLPEDGQSDTLLDALQRQLKQTFKLKAAVKKCQDSGEPFSISDISIDDKFIRILGSAIKISEESESIGVVLLVEDMTEAKMLDRSKDEFVSIASHELRTPLTAIRGNLSLMQLMYADKFKDKDVRQMMDDTIDSVIRLISIVNQFLTTSRLEQKKTVFQYTKVDIGALIKSVTSDLRTMADESNLEMIINVPAHLPDVKADAGRVQGVLNNLIGNAIKYSDKGTITVTAEKAKDKVVVRVTDTGQGIDPQNQHLLFQKFQQATDSILTRDDSRSTGLGLYITRMMIEQMDGEIKLDKSELGKGSTFSFSLPIA